MAEVNTALIAFIGVLAGGYFNNFLGEDYRRFRDGQALAGALAGELESHAEPLKWMKDGLEKMALQAMTEEGLTLPEWPIPPSPIFDSNTAKIGLLGAEMAKEVAYVYENLRAFRINFHQLSKHHHEIKNKEWNVAMVNGCTAALHRAEHRGLPLIASLKRYADVKYGSLPSTRKQYKIGAGILIALVLFTLIGSCSSSSGQNCTTVVDQAKGTSTTVCK
ncbi:hypothetical protein AB4Y42_41235 [Paraburkholderia sp. EG286B]|uniref:hypothetical protein n=1 Tax=Paraburkholderia sp. EG286B TaxID=3237011 RepID=UPI0034D2AF0A